MIKTQYSNKSNRRRAERAAAKAAKLASLEGAEAVVAGAKVTAVAKAERRKAAPSRGERRGPPFPFRPLPTIRPRRLPALSNWRAARKALVERDHRTDGLARARQPQTLRRLGRRVGLSLTVQNDGAQTRSYVRRLIPSTMRQGARGRSELPTQSGGARRRRSSLEIRPIYSISRGASTMRSRKRPNGINCYYRCGRILGGSNWFISHAPHPRSSPSPLAARMIASL